MGNFGRNDNRGGGFSRGGFGRGNDRGGFSRGGGRSFGNDRDSREMFKTTCSNCGRDCEVPFRPTNGKPVYCSDCFEKMPHFDKSSRGEGNGDRRDERPSFRPQVPVSAPNNSQLEELNAKLDKIISLLEPKKVEVKTESEVVNTPEVKKVKKSPVKK